METAETRAKLANAIRDLQSKGDTQTIDRLVSAYKNKYKKQGPFKFDIPKPAISKEENIAKQKAEAERLTAESKKLNSPWGMTKNFGKALISNLAPSEVGLGKTIAAISTSPDPYVTNVENLSGKNRLLLKTIKEKEAKGEDATKFKNLYNQNVDLIEENKNTINANNAALPTQGQAAGQLGGTALDVLTLGTYGKAATGMTTGVLGKAKPSILTQVRKPTGLLTKQGTKQVVTGGAIGYGYDVTQGLQGARGEDKTGAGAFKPGIGTLIGSGIPAALNAEQSVKNTFNKTARNERAITKVTKELKEIENNYAKLSDEMDVNTKSRNRVVKSNVLKGSVTPEGKIKTKEAAKLYQKRVLDGKEGVVRTDLAREGASVSPETVYQKLEAKIKSSTLSGAEKKAALDSIKKEIQGLLIDSPDGNIPLTTIHDAKISKAKGVNWSTDPFKASKRKAFASAYKEVVEEISKLPIKKINKELQKYYKDIDYILSLNNKTVEGGSLGKHFAKISGNIVGGAVGSAIGGPVGGALGVITGGELSGRIGSMMRKGTLSAVKEGVFPQSKLLEEAAIRSKSPQSKFEGSMNTKYNAVNNANINAIPKSVSEITPNVKQVIPKAETPKEDVVFKALKAREQSLVDQGWIKKEDGKTIILKSSDKPMTVKDGVVPKQLISKTDLKTLVKASGQKELNMEIISKDGDKFISYKNGNQSILIKPSALGLPERNLTPGDKVNLNLDNLKVTGKHITGNYEGKGEKQIIIGTAISLLGLTLLGKYGPQDDENSPQAKMRQDSQKKESTPVQEITRFGEPIDSIKEKIALRETRGEKDPYKATNENDNGTTDYGKYQANEQTLKHWFKVLYNKNISPEQFLNEPETQEKFFEDVMKRFEEEYEITDWKHAAALWHKGWGPKNLNMPKDAILAAAEDYIKEPQN